jgi:hypothetical protein
MLEGRKGKNKKGVVGKEVIMRGEESKGRK